MKSGSVKRLLHENLCAGVLFFLTDFFLVALKFFAKKTDFIPQLFLQRFHHRGIALAARSLDLGLQEQFFFSNLGTGAALKFRNLLLLTGRERRRRGLRILLVEPLHGEFVRGFHSYTWMKTASPSTLVA